MARLLNQFGDRPDVLDAVRRSMHTFSWSGSPPTYYALYREPLRALCDHPMGQVRRWAETLRRQLDIANKNARNENEEQDSQGDI